MNKKRFLKPAIIGLIALVIIAGAVSFGFNYAKAEQSGSTPDSGVTSYIKQLYGDLQTLTFGSDTDSPDWGTFWNRIKTAARWTPSTTATTSDVSSTKTYTPSGSRTATSGTFNLDNLTIGTVKNGTAFGVSLTGQYPSATYPLTGAGTVAGAGNVASGKVAWSNDGTQITGSGAMGGPCSTQVFDDSQAGATQGNNCSLTWTTASPPVTGDDQHAGITNKDPMTGLVWSQYLKNNAGVIQFVSSGGSTWSWNATAANNVAVGNLTAKQLCSSSSNPAGAGVWRLPTQKEMMQAYIDGTFWNLSLPTTYYYSATELAAGSGAWNVDLTNGNTGYNYGEGVTISVRCVR